MKFSNQAFALICMLGLCTPLASAGQTYETSKGTIVCDDTSEKYVDNVGFPVSNDWPIKKCKFETESWNLSCKDIADAVFTSGCVGWDWTDSGKQFASSLGDDITQCSMGWCNKANKGMGGYDEANCEKFCICTSSLEGKKVYPNASGKGWKIDGSPFVGDKSSGYASNTFKIQDGVQYGVDTKLTNTNAPQVPVNIFLSADLNFLAYGSVKDMNLDAVIMNGGLYHNVYVGNNGGHDGLYAPNIPGKGPTDYYNTTSLEFCFTAPTISEPSPEPQPEPNPEPAPQPQPNPAPEPAQPQPNPAPEPAPQPYQPFPGPQPGPEPQPLPDPTASGDPHFKTWLGKKFDFHGGCDLVLVENPHFANGLGLDVHVRTKIYTWWSYIESAAIKLGDHILEIAGGMTQISYWLNGAKIADMKTGDAALGDYPVHFRRVNDHQSITRIQLGNGNAISIETYKYLVRVNVGAPAADKFSGSYGMLGSYPEGKMHARDKVTIIEDPNEFGQEWMVLPSEPKLFHSESATQHPMKCPMPTETKKSQSRRLGEAMIGEEEAALACSRVAKDDRDACIVDVMATQDKDMAGSY